MGGKDGPQLAALEGWPLSLPEPEAPVCRRVGGGAKLMPSPRENAEAQDRARRRGVKRGLGGEGDKRQSRGGRRALSAPYGQDSESDYRFLWDSTGFSFFLTAPAPPPVVNHPTPCCTSRLGSIW